MLFLVVLVLLVRYVLSRLLAEVGRWERESCGATAEDTIRRE